MKKKAKKDRGEKQPARTPRGKAKPISDDVRFIAKHCLPFIRAMREVVPYHPEPVQKDMLEAADVLEQKILGRLLIRSMHDGTLPAVHRALSRSSFKKRDLDLVTRAYMNVAYSQGRRPTFKEIDFEVREITPSGEKPPSFKTVQRISDALFQVERRAMNRKQVKRLLDRI